jgi:DNA-directed RNA polymerase specialized sigma24 family protein
VKVVMMVHHDVQTPTFDEFFLAEFPRLVSMLTAWCGDRSVPRISLNRSSNEGRRRRRERAALSRLHVDERTEITVPTADDQLWEHVRALPATQRDATIMRYVDDLPLADIAAVLGCRDGTVKTHLQRARRTLASHLSTDAEARR